MPKFELDPESILRAEEISSHLMKALRGGRDRVAYTPIYSVFPEMGYRGDEERGLIDDVVANVSNMATDFATARRWDGEIPCLKLEDGSWAPISFGEFFAGFYGSEREVMYDGPYFDRQFPPYRVWHETLKYYQREEENVIVAKIDEAEKRVEQSLNLFLAHRFAGIKRFGQWMKRKSKFVPPFLYRIYNERSRNVPPSPPGISENGGLKVRVSCRTPGLRLHVSPAYFINWIYFGSPSSPVESYVLPGRYVFAGDGPMLPRRRKDPTVFSIPADFYPNIVRF